MQIKNEPDMTESSASTMFATLHTGIKNPQRQQWTIAMKQQSIAKYMGLCDRQKKTVTKENAYKVDNRLPGKNFDINKNSSYLGVSTTDQF
jgi:hypothetical protein